ncbi:LacI family DNA-binding transcriptional regulator, partial [Streptomyces sp. NPDC127044]
MSRRAPTLEDVAREAGVSRATVSRVVNGVQSVDPALQDAVRQAVETPRYPTHPAPPARGSRAAPQGAGSPT